MDTVEVPDTPLGSWKNALNKAHSAAGDTSFVICSGSSLAKDSLENIRAMPSPSVAINQYSIAPS
jgi:hypothetical protein